MRPKLPFTPVALVSILTRPKNVLSAISLFTPGRAVAYVSVDYFNSLYKSRWLVEPTPRKRQDLIFVVVVTLD
jgi:hypothetical protein